MATLKWRFEFISICLLFLFDRVLGYAFYFCFILAGFNLGWPLSLEFYAFDLFYLSFVTFCVRFLPYISFIPSLYLAGFLLTQPHLLTFLISADFRNRLSFWILTRFYEVPEFYTRITCVWPAGDFCVLRQVNCVSLLFSRSVEKCVLQQFCIDFRAFFSDLPRFLWDIYLT